MPESTELRTRKKVEFDSLKKNALKEVEDLLNEAKDPDKEYRSDTEIEDQIKNLYDRALAIFERTKSDFDDFWNDQIIQDRSYVFHNEKDIILERIRTNLSVIYDCDVAISKIKNNYGNRITNILEAQDSDTSKIGEQNKIIKYNLIKQNKIEKL